MEEQKQHINYSAADIRRYLQGELSPKEMHAMEKAALDDPFLADAIEGMQQAMEEHDASLVTGRLQELHNEFGARTANKSKTATVVRFRWWQMAAAAVIVIAGALWIYNLTITGANKIVMQSTVPHEQETTASIKPPPVPENQQAPAADSAVPTFAQQQPATTHARTVPEKRRSNAAVTRKKTEFVAAAELKDTSNLVAANDYATLKKAEENRKESIKEALAAKQNSVQTQPAANEKQPYAFSNRETELITIAKNDSPAKPAAANNNNLSGFVKGRVTDPFNNPVANAYVSTTNNNRFNILTDKTGTFKVPATSDSIVNVSVNVVGYGTQNFRLQNNASLNELQLQPANANLEEVVFTSMKLNKKAKAQTPTVMMQDAQPVFGWVAYDQYLENNKKRPAGYPVLTGNVVVSFMVHKKGELSDFKIEQSLAKPYDDEAIRLISQGPAWKLNKGRKTRITVIVRF